MGCNCTLTITGAAELVNCADLLHPVVNSASTSRLCVKGKVASIKDKKFPPQGGCQICVPEVVNFLGSLLQNQGELAALCGRFYTYRV